MLPVVLQTRRLTLTQLADADEPALVSLYESPANMEHIDPGGRPKARTLEFLGRMRAQWTALGFGFFSVRELGAPRIIGSAGLLVREPGRPVELGYLLDQPFWGKGYATELCEELVRWGFAEHHPERIIADIHPLNAASIQVVRKLGFVRDGDGERGSHRFTVSREAWLER